VNSILLAVPELADEPQLVGQAAAAGLRVVRRCVDAVDLLAAAATSTDTIAVLSAGLPRLNADVVARLGAGRLVVGLARDDAAAEALAGLGVAVVVRAAPSAAQTMTLVADACRSGLEIGAAGVWSTRCWAPADDEPPRVSGRLVVVWGPMGSPGRTTVALGVSEALAGDGRSVCLVDADTYAPTVTLALGLVEEVSGLLLACRHAEHGSLGEDSLMSACCRVRPRWHVLGGLSDPQRWSELRAGALDRVWSACRETFDVTVVDVGFCLEDDTSPGAWARQRNSAALSVVPGADHVLAVAGSDVVGAARLVTAWPALMELAESEAVTVVRNRAEGGRRDWAAAVRAGGVAAPVLEVPSDAKALAACWAGGRSLREGARRSRARRALDSVAAAAVSG
jgi:MinD-like ATPase involved in chromosome partitioning or flagellar assembly